MKPMSAFSRVALGIGLCILALATGGAVKIVQDTCSPFTDVTPGFCPYVLELYCLGITVGTSATTFSPDQSLTRGQAAVFVAKGLNQSLARSSRRAALGQWWTTTPQYTLHLGITGVPFRAVCTPDARAVERQRIETRWHRINHRRQRCRGLRGIDHVEPMSAGAAEGAYEDPPHRRAERIGVGKDPSFQKSSVARPDASHGSVVELVRTRGPDIGPVADDPPQRVSDNSVTVVQASTGVVLATLTGNGLNLPWAAAFDGQRVLVTSLFARVSLFKATDLSPIGSFDIGFGNAPYQASSDGTNFFISVVGLGAVARY